MPQMKKATGPPPVMNKRTSSTVAKTSGYQSQVKKHPSERKRPVEASIYGEEIFQPNIKREKEIVICFHPFTENNLRISTEGKFIIEKIEFKVPIPPEIPEEPILIEVSEVEESFREETHWNLYYFPTPISDFKPPEKVEEFCKVSYLINQEACEIFLDFSDLKPLEDKVVALVRDEFLYARLVKIAEMKQADLQEKIEKEAKEKKEEEEREESDGLAKEVTEESATNSVPENSISEINNQEVKEVPEEITQEGTGEINPV
jgi:hypothetical protein